MPCIIFHTAAVHRLHPTFLHLAIPVGYFFIDLAQGLPFRAGLPVTASSAFINVPFEFVVDALLGGRRERLRFWRFFIPLLLLLHLLLPHLLRRAVYNLSAR